MLGARHAGLESFMSGWFSAKMENMVALMSVKRYVLLQ
jgi:hypothetical protein